MGRTKAPCACLCLGLSGLICGGCALPAFPTVPLRSRPVRADSSTARALALHARGSGFESPSAHLNWLDPVYAAIGLVTAPWWARKNRSGWAERFGRIDAV